jgi:hypothetical protein
MLTIFRVLHIANDISDNQLRSSRGNFSLPDLSDSQLVYYHFLGVLDPDFKYFVLSITLQEPDLIAFLDGSREDSDQSDNTSEMIVAISLAVYDTSPHNVQVIKDQSSQFPIFLLPRLRCG